MSSTLIALGWKILARALVPIDENSLVTILSNVLGEASWEGTSPCF